MEQVIDRAKLNLTISIMSAGHEEGILIGKDVIRALGMPTYICVLKGKDKKSIAIAPAKEKEYLSWEVPDGYLNNKNKKFRVYSRAFVKGIIKANKLDPSKTHKVIGTYDEKQNLVIFPLKV